MKPILTIFFSLISNKQNISEPQILQTLSVRIAGSVRPAGNQPKRDSQLEKCVRFLKTA